MKGGIQGLCYLHRPSSRPPVKLRGVVGLKSRNARRGVLQRHGTTQQLFPLLPLFPHRAMTPETLCYETRSSPRTFWRRPPSASGRQLKLGGVALVASSGPGIRGTKPLAALGVRFCLLHWLLAFSFWLVLLPSRHAADISIR